MARNLKMQITSHPAAALYLRHVLTWKHYWRQFLTMRLIEPCVFFFGISIGLGALVHSMGGHDYKSFVLPGVICSTLMFVGIIEGSYIAFSRHSFSGLWQSWLAAPTRVRDIMASEMGWAASRGMMIVLMLSVVGTLFGVKLSILGILAVLPIAALTVMVLMAYGYVFSALAKSFDDFDYVWVLTITPQLTFSGIMFDIGLFPNWLWWAAQAFPLTHAVALIRPLMLGETELLPVLAHLGALLAMGIAATWYAERRFTQKMTG